MLDIAMVVRGHRRCVTALLALGLLLMVSCDSNSDRPILRIATDATFAPFHLVDESGRATGFDVELARAVATQAGFEPTIDVLPYEEMFIQLKDGTIDVVAATTGITPERMETYLFSEPYFETCQVAVVRAGPTEPQDLVDLQGLQIGASGEGTSMKGMLTLDATHIDLEGMPGVDALQANRVDAWIVDEFDGLGAAAKSDGALRVIPTAVAMEQYAFVIEKNRADIKSLMDSGLTLLEESGRLSQLRVEFGIERSGECPDL